ncbi:metal ABC transporter substrate-binding protein [Anaerocolumna sp.]|uniref:metal ABC transporter substrate-binding protein n=1 Tax=Anaerocolumna sp. TaxID=2041569 RepID=UPI0028ABBE2B|nr:metal ABC transporter substrate-binding protein [Anaerocolumna sp.]
MKRFISLIFMALLVAVPLAGCSRSSKSYTNNKLVDNGEKISVVSTIFPSYDFTREVAGDKADVTMLLPPGSESHSFEPTPQDIIKIQNCDIFLYVGGESDQWVNEVLESMDTSKMKIITLMDCVQVVEEEVVEGMEEEEHTDDHETEEEHADGEEKEHAHDHGEEEPEYDEHVWTSPKNAKRIVQIISDALCDTDTANAAFYQTNTEDYLTKLDELDSKFQDAVDNNKRKTIVFGDRFPFRYFADAYGLKYFAAFPGCSTETEASAATVKFLIDKINTEKIPVVFHIELSNEKMADTISEATGAKVLLMHACHNISKSDFESGKNYIELMTANVEALKEALQ